MFTMPTNNRFRACLFTAALALAAAPNADAQAITRDSLRIFYVGRPVGWERYALSRADTNM